MGCWKDKRKDRALPKLIMTDRDPGSPHFSNILIPWGAYKAYLSQLICRCAKKAEDKGFVYFGIQFYGKKNINT